MTFAELKEKIFDLLNTYEEESEEKTSADKEAEEEGEEGEEGSSEEE